MKSLIILLICYVACAQANCFDRKSPIFSKCLYITAAIIAGTIIILMLLFSITDRIIKRIEQKQAAKEKAETDANAMRNVFII